MSALQLLRAACEKKSYLSFTNLKPGEYTITNFAIVQTTYGERIKVEMGDQFLFLPDRFNEKIKVEHLAELNRYPKRMIYGGKDPEEFNRYERVEKFLSQLHILF